MLCAVGRRSLQPAPATLAPVAAASASCATPVPRQYSPLPPARTTHQQLLLVRRLALTEGGAGCIRLSGGHAALHAGAGGGAAVETGRDRRAWTSQLLCTFPALPNAGCAGTRSADEASRPCKGGGDRRHRQLWRTRARTAPLPLPPLHIAHQHERHADGGRSRALGRLTQREGLASHRRGAAAGAGGGPRGGLEGASGCLHRNGCGDSRNGGADLGGEDGRRAAALGLLSIADGQEGVRWRRWRPGPPVESRAMRIDSKLLCALAPPHARRLSCLSGLVKAGARGAACGEWGRQPLLQRRCRRANVFEGDASYLCPCLIPGSQVAQRRGQACRCHASCARPPDISTTAVPPLSAKPPLRIPPLRGPLHPN